MLLPLNWLRDYIKVKLSPKELAEILMFKSFEVESVKEDILDLSITPNRTDCLSIFGLAREVGTLTNQKVIFPTPTFSPYSPTSRGTGGVSARGGSALGGRGGKFKESKTKASEFLEVKVEDKKLCPQYCARVIKGVKIGSSPKWLAEHLESVGLRPINNVVDITNFMLFEMGQPLHAFSMQKLKIKNQKSKTEILVRNAKKGEKILALDEKEYILDESNLVITDGERPIAIAGVIGGEETGVSAGGGSAFGGDEKTKDIVLESAIFEPRSVRLTSKKLGIRTESSLRFERGFDPNLTRQAIDRAADLIVEYCGGEVLKGVIQVGKIPSVRKNIKVSVDEINSLIGIKLPEKKIVSILKLLNCSIKKQDKNLIVSPPSYRLDLNLPADIAEEAARIYGYNKLPEKYLVGEIVPPRKDGLLEATKFIRGEMLKMGFDEVYNSSFYGEKELEWVGALFDFPRESARRPRSSALEIENPLSPEEKYFRASLLPGLFKDILLNENNFEEIKIFEIGKVVTPSNSPYSPTNRGTGGERTPSNSPYSDTSVGTGGEPIPPKEETRIAGVISLKEKDYNIYRQIKGIWSKISFDQGIVGIKINGFKNPVGYFEFSLDKILPQISKKVSFKSLPKFPGIDRDLSVIVPEDISWGKLEETVKESAGDLLKEIGLFDIFPEIEKGKKSLAFHLHFLHSERTLKNEEIDKIISKIIKNLENLGAIIRK